MERLYPNWPVIAKLTSDYWHLMQAIEIAAMDPTDKINKRLIEAFPECFSKEKVRGPIPLSFIIEELRDLNGKDEQVEGIQTDLVHREIIGGSGYDIPMKHFSFTKADVEARRREGLDHELAPKSLATFKKVSDVVRHQGKEWVVVEWSRASEQATICSTDYIDPTV
jgi:hypothetical protein